MTAQDTNDKLAKIGRLYDDGAPLVSIVREIGTDADSLRLISRDLGVAMSTLRRVATEVADKPAAIRVKVYDGEAAGMDTDGGRWQVVCETHGAILSVATRRQAQEDARNARAANVCEWCEDCHANLSPPVRELRERIAALEARKLQTVGHGRRAQYDADLARMRAELSELEKVDDTLAKLKTADDIRAEGDKIAAEINERGKGFETARVDASGDVYVDADDQTDKAPWRVSREHSGTEDGFLWYVVGADGSRPDDGDTGGWLHREDAEMEAADRNKLAQLSPDQRGAVLTMRGWCQTPDSYAVAVVGTLREGSHGAMEMRVSNGRDDASPSELRGQLARDYARETGCVLVDVYGVVFEIVKVAANAILSELDATRGELERMRERPFAGACGDADRLADRETDLRRELAEVNGIGTDAEKCGRCGARSDWHADDGQCPDDDGPHPYSLAADADYRCPSCGFGPRATLEASHAPDCPAVARRLPACS